MIYGMLLRASMALVVGVFILAGNPASASADVVYTKEDRATVRVLAVQGVVTKKVQPPTITKKEQSVSIAVAQGGHGSGVLISSDGIVATAAHVVEDAEFVAVKVPGKQEALLAVVLYESKKYDVAFLKVAGTYADFIPLPESAPVLDVRSPVYALGYPFDGTREYPQSNAGIVAGALPNGELQLGISANPGNSGGPLINAAGALLGLVVRSANVKAGAQGIAVAVPISTVMRFYDKRVRDSERLKKARLKERELARAGAAAEVIARIASVTSIGTAVDHIEETDDKLKDALVRAQVSHRGSADFLAILAGHYWNESIIRLTMDGRFYEAPKNKAVQLAKTAVRLDSNVTRRSPFLYSVLGKSSSGQNNEKTTHVAPRMLAGFRLGWTLSQAREACELEDFAFEDLGTKYRCSEPPTVEDLSGPVDIYLCGNTVCRIDVIDRPSKALSKVWVEEFMSRYKHFKSHYGVHDAQDVHFPDSCRKNVLSCLETGTARLIYRWSWEGRRLTLSLGRLHSSPTMRITLVDETAQAKSQSAPDTAAGKKQPKLD